MAFDGHVTMFGNANSHNFILMMIKIMMMMMRRRRRIRMFTFFCNEQHYHDPYDGFYI